MTRYTFPIQTQAVGAFPYCSLLLSCVAVRQVRLYSLFYVWNGAVREMDTSVSVYLYVMLIAMQVMPGIGGYVFTHTHEGSIKAGGFSQ